MQSERLFTTREVAEMWNVSPSTIKRWADSGTLECRRTPGGHRKFTLQDISEFQTRQGFEANGLLSDDKCEDPEIERAVNQKNFQLLQRQVLELGAQNQRLQLRRILERLHIRGLEFCDLYDHLVFPALLLAHKGVAGETYSLGHLRLLRHNLDEAMLHLVPKVSQRKPNNKISLCCGLDREGRIHVNAVARVLELEGWDAYNLGCQVDFDLMKDMVDREPIELICICGTTLDDPKKEGQHYQGLHSVADSYRIPVLMAGEAFSPKSVQKHFPSAAYVKSLRAVRRRAIRRG